VPRFEELFGCAPQAMGQAPGRVNLLGEHTDYNQGLVLPLAIARHVTVQVARSDDRLHRFHSVQLDSMVTWTDAGSPPAGFARYLHGCMAALRARGHAVPPLRGRVDSDVPIGAGLSSSAALEVAMLRALRSLLGLDIDDEQIALLGHEAENDYVGVHSGILDQMASSFASTTQMLYLDTRSLERRLLPLPAGTSALIMDSGQARSLAGSGYNLRRAECQRAAELLGLASLRDVVGPVPDGRLPPALARRVRHVYTENARVLRAISGADARLFGSLMNQSHGSLASDYEVSTPALDALADALRDQPEVFGAKLTGAGFGGACVALVRTGRGEEVGSRVASMLADDHPGVEVLVAG
jgi:galactokinase